MLGWSAEQRQKLTAAVRRGSAGGNLVVILSTSVEGLLRSVPSYSVPEKLDNLLRAVARLTPRVDQKSTFLPAFDFPLVPAEDEHEVHYLILALQARGLVDTSSRSPKLTVSGWERLEEMTQAGKNSDRAFVAMWFDKTMDPLYIEAIESAILEAGYKPLRIDKTEHVNRIDDEIIANIRRSRFMVADFTGQRHGVYFESGMMLGLGRAVIWMCDKEELRSNSLHFDVRQFNFIDWESIEDAKKRLKARIVALEGPGPHMKESGRPGRSD